MNRNDGSYLKNELYKLLQKDSSIFEFLQNGSLDGIWYWDLEFPDNEWMSPSFWETLGYDPAEKKYLASEWQNLIHPEDLKKALDNFEAHCRDPKYPYNQIVRYRHKNGSTVWVRCRGIVIRDVDGKPLRMLGAHNDITELKKTQEELQVFADKLKQINQQLVEQIKEREETEAALQYQLEFNQLITSILTRFINVKLAEIPAGIEQALQKIGQFTRVDTSYIFRWDNENKTFSMVYEWVAPGQKAQHEKVQNLTRDAFPWAIDTLLRGEVLYVPSVVDLGNKTAGERQNMLTFNLKSLLCIPLIFQDVVLGWVGLASFSENKLWTESNIEFFRIFAKILTNVMQRQQTEKALWDSEQVEAKLRHDIFHDSLTGLPNRALLLDRLKQALKRKQRHPDWLFAVLFLDLDRFKIINDSLGHLTGDQLLIALGSRLEKCLRSSDTLARLGGDEFVILLEELQSEDEAVKIAERIHQALKKPFVLKNQELFVSASIGITFSSSHDYNEPAQLLRDADTAMYQAKELGKTCHAVFEPFMHTHAQKRLQLENDLRRAISRQELVVYYQPILSLETNCLQGMEALVRWQHPSLGLVSPTDFISIAEETGIIIALDQWVLKNACLQVSYWKKQFPAFSHLTLSVNFSGKQFFQSGLIQKTGQILAETGLEGQYLRLEITESVLIENYSSVLKRLNQLRDEKIQVCLDDFGTGYSSLSYLNRFPINILKIDRSFIKNLDIKDSQSAIVRAILVMARELKIKVIAEGVETAEQINFLKALGCFGAQGYWFSHPLDTEEMTQFLKTYCERF